VILRAQYIKPAGAPCYRPCIGRPKCRPPVCGSERPHPSSPDSQRRYWPWTRTRSTPLCLRRHGPYTDTPLEQPLPANALRALRVPVRGDSLNPSLPTSPVLYGGNCSEHEFLLVGPPVTISSDWASDFGSSVIVASAWVFAAVEKCGPMGSAEFRLARTREARQRTQPSTVFPCSSIARDTVSISRLVESRTELLGLHLREFLDKLLFE